VLNWVTINRFCELSGYSDKAVRSKMAEGVWLKDVVWCKAPDNRILISLRGYEAWVEGQVFASVAMGSKSTSATVVSAAANFSD
jgi:hypothetical protein